MKRAGPAEAGRVGGSVLGSVTLPVDCAVGSAFMSKVYGITEIVGSSTKSYDDAITQATQTLLGRCGLR